MNFIISFISAKETLKIAWEVLYFATIVSAVVVVISANRNPVKSISWILILIFLPFLGLIFYFFFGQDIRRRYLPRKEIKKLRELNSGRNLFGKAPEVKPEYDRLVKLYDRNLYPLLSRNSIRIFTSGKEKFETLFEDLRNAENHIHLEYYIFSDDEIGQTVKNILIEKAQNGVEVRVIYDDVGSWHTKKRFFRELTDGGVEVYSFLKVHFPSFTGKMNYRNHRKIVIIDGLIGYIGGMNIASRYISGTPWGGSWEDMHVRIDGESVLGLQIIFLIDWSLAENSFLSDKKYFPTSKNTGNINTQVVAGGPTSRWKEILQGFLKAITGARKYAYIQTPYFLPTETLLMALQLAATSGVDVRLMVPEKSDSIFIRAATHSFIKEVLKMGVKIYFYRTGFLHSKMMVIDDYFSTIGSTNMDFRSFEHNFEANVFIYDEGIAEMLKNKFLDDISRSERITLHQWEKRPRMQKFFESVVRLFSPLL
ncbi:MAG: cardiolipin synthase [Candidatus Azobacteroides sp.]|nr:cardiolipin synthase [Candidatus Azobacteroides sp.]